jgi:LPXTG-site transpeptidase (sortase) family protein
MIWLRRLSWLMTAAAAGLLIWVGVGIGSTLHNQMVEAQQWDQATYKAVVPVGGLLPFSHPPFAPGAQVAKMDIPAIGYSAIVLEGTNDHVLANGPGHFIGTAYPGEPSTMIVSGHNTFMLSLPELKKGDQVIFTDPDGRFVYVLDGSKIVDPSKRLDIGSGGQANLDLTTCWPIWAGAFATQRLVIFGHLVTS